jgi:DNA polymerase-3 subunit alpha
VTVFNELFDKHRDKLKEDALIVAVCKVQVPRDESFGGLRVSAEDLLDLNALRTRYAQKLRLDINGQADAKRLKAYLAPFKSSSETSGCPVVVHYHNGVAEVDVALSPDWRVRPDDQLLAQLVDWLTPAGVRVVY